MLSAGTEGNDAGPGDPLAVSRSFPNLNRPRSSSVPGRLRPWTSTTPPKQPAAAVLVGRAMTPSAAPRRPVSSGRARMAHSPTTARGRGGEAARGRAAPPWGVGAAGPPPAAWDASPDTAEVVYPTSWTQQPGAECATHDSLDDACPPVGAARLLSASSSSKFLSPVRAGAGGVVAGGSAALTRCGPKLTVHGPALAALRGSAHLSITHLHLRRVPWTQVVSHMALVQLLTRMDTLTLEGNGLCRLRQLDVLTALTALRHLQVLDNAAAELSLTRAYAVHRLRGLHSLNGRAVTAEERRAAHDMWQHLDDVHQACSAANAALQLDQPRQRRRGISARGAASPAAAAPGGVRGFTAAPECQGGVPAAQVGVGEAEAAAGRRAAVQLLEDALRVQEALTELDKIWLDVMKQLVHEGVTGYYHVPQC